jgi:transcriptional regulator with XRE-family HTH domain
VAREPVAEDRSAVAHYELGNGDIPGKVLKQLADLFHVPMAVLLENTDEEAVSHVS